MGNHQFTDQINELIHFIHCNANSGGLHLGLCGNLRFNRLRHYSSFYLWNAFRRGRTWRQRSGGSGRVAEEAISHFRSTINWRRSNFRCVNEADLVLGHMECEQIQQIISRRGCFYCKYAHTRDRSGYVLDSAQARDITEQILDSVCLLCAI